MQLRAAQPADIPTLAETHIASWQAAYRGLMPNHIIDKHTVQSRTDTWMKTLVDAPGSLLVAAIDNRVVAFSFFGPSREPNAPVIEAEIMAIYVHPDHWRTGIGRALWQYTQEHLQNKFTSIILWVLRDNQKARRFYEAMGFKYVEGSEKQLPWFGNAPEVCYHRDLSQTT
jgi:ribosomal protein S18 acetylase RimI-like enzyme